MQRWHYSIRFQSNFNEIKTLNNSKDNLITCKYFYNKIYNNIGHHFAEYLKTLPEKLINEIEKEINDKWKLN